MNRNMLKGYLFVIASAFIFGCMPLGTKFIYAEGVNTLSLVFLRSVISLPILALIVKAQGESLKISLGAFAEISLISMMGCCITPLLLFRSYMTLASGTATVFHFIYPSIVVLGGILFFREKPRAKMFLCVLLCTVGICMFYNPAEPIDMTGSALALLSGCTYAIYVLLLSGLRHKEVSGFKFTLYISIICSAVMLIVCLVSGELVLPTTLRGWILCILFSLAICIGAVLLFQQGTFLIGGQRAAILSTVEPITSIFMGILIFKESVGLRTVIGSLLVVLASILIAVFDVKTAKSES